MSTTSNADPFAMHGCHGRFGHDGPPFPVKAAIVIGGLFIFPPLGLAALAYFALRHKFAGHPGWHHWQEKREAAMASWRERQEPATGNTAFEARRREVLAKIEAERQKLRDEAKAFTDFADREKRARDQAEFDRFKAAEAANAGDTKTE